jgi:hypothetical protein
VDVALPMRRLQEVGRDKAEADDARNGVGNENEDAGAGNGNPGNIEAVENGADGDALDADAKGNKEPNVLEQGADDAVQKDKEVQRDIIIEDMAGANENESGEDDTKDVVENAGADQADKGNSEEMLKMKARADDEESDENDDANTEDEREEAFANDKLAEEVRKDTEEDAAQEKENGVEIGGFLNAGDAKVDVGKRPEGENAEQEIDEDEENKNVEDSDNDEDEGENQGAQVKAKPVEGVPDRDPSSYDTWMGVLSSTSVAYFVRVVPSSEVGATYLDDYKY